MALAAAAPPGTRGLPFIGHLPEFRRQPALFLERMAARYGPLAYFRLGPQNVYLLNEPDYIKDVLVTHNARFIKSRMLERAKVLLGEGLLTANGAHHLRQRRMMQPAFHRERLQGYAATMAACAQSAREQIRPGVEFDLDQAMMRLTLQIVGRTLFNADVEKDASDIGQALTAVLHLFDVLMLPFSELIEKVPFLPASRRLIAARETLDRVIYGIIRERRASGADHGDLLSMLLMAQDEDDGSGMTDQQVRDEALTLFLAGHETTANALTWTWYLLSQNPQAEARMHAEIDSVLNGRLPGFDDYPHLPYTEMVFAESMRLFPPAWGIGRRSIEPHEVAGFEIPTGSILVMSPWVTQRTARFYPDPLRFDPERFLPEAREARPKFAYFPFGGGPRVCIGERFAWLEGVLLLATLAQRWRFRLVPGHPVETLPLITLRTRHGMRMIAERRSA